jgi:hypothetical protein
VTASIEAHRSDDVDIGEARPLYVETPAKLWSGLSDLLTSALAPQDQTMSDFQKGLESVGGFFTNLVKPLTEIGKPTGGHVLGGEGKPPVVLNGTFDATFTEADEVRLIRSAIWVEYMVLSLLHFASQRRMM